ncbi:MAG: GH116 family glycosyl hydrolase, partial [Clostridia bacterium]
DTAGCGDMGTLCASTRVEAGMQKTLRFTLCWYYPVQINRWNPSPDGHNTWKNHYATRFDGAAAVAHDALARWDDLAARTRAFSDALFASTLPLEVLDAVSANLAVLKSPTVLRLEDGSLYGWEGVNEHAGSCEGSCTHVWAYQYAVPFLFPALARSMRELEYHSNLWENGGMSFRLQLPVGRAHAGDTPCVDGQMASVLGVYREWKLCGDNDWLRMLWPSVRASIAFTWSPTNAFRWDADKDGILEGRQHHTLDVELFGPSSWLQGLYLAALKAGAAMADALEDTETAACYRALYANGRAFTDTQLFNGAYYEQRIDLCDRTVLAPYPAAEAFYWNDEAGQIKYQIGHGCAIDQVNAQWHANLLGLGALYDHTQLLKALQSIYTYNFQPSMRDSFNPCRVFSLNDEGGTVICAYPEGVEKPVVPIPYCQETMTGFEYQAACLMISEGMVQQGLTILRAIRDRYDGRKRNPWNEIECGNNYARSMASYSLLATYTGFTFDLPRGIIGFHPILPADGRFQGVWSVDSGWGIVTEDAHGMTIRILAGKLTIAGLALPCLDAACVQLDGQDTPIRREAALLLFPARQHVLREIRILRAPSEE